jgi:hypothetical protein
MNEKTPQDPSVLLRFLYLVYSLLFFLPKIIAFLLWSFFSTSCFFNPQVLNRTFLYFIAQVDPESFAIKGLKCSYSSGLLNFTTLPFDS